MTVQLLCSILFSFFLWTDPVEHSGEQAEEFYQRGVSRLKAKEYLKAIGDFTHAISLKPDFAKAYHQRAIAKNLFGQKMGFFNAELCYDLVAAMKYGDKAAISELNDLGKKECHTAQTAFEQPDMTFCVDLNSSVISELPDGFEQLALLTQINLWNNKFQFFPDLSTATFLINLNLGSNQLKSVDASIGSFEWLYELNLSKNQLADLPSEMGKLKNLKLLNLRNNNLVDLPSEIAQMESLETLDLSLNGLTKLPKVLYEMKNLKYLILSGNELPLTEVEKIKKALPGTNVTF